METTSMADPLIGLTLQQIHDLRQLADGLRDTQGDITDNRVWFDGLFRNLFRPPRA